MSAFGDAFKKARKKFEKSGSAGDYVFEHNGKKYSILKKGETKKGVMKKFSAPAKSLKPKLRPRLDDLKDSKITSRKLSPSTVGKGRGDGNYETNRRTIDRSANAKPGAKVAPPVKPSAPTQPSGGGGSSKPTTNAGKLDAWKAGDKGLSSKEQFRLAKWAERNDLSVPKDLAKDSVRLSLKTSKNKGGPVTKKPKGAYAAGGSMPMVMKDGKKVPAYAADGVGKMNMGGMTKKKPAAKMMAGGMAKKKMMGGGMVKYQKGGMQSSPGTVNTMATSSFPSKDSVVSRKPMTKNGTMTYNMGGMVKSQVDNLKKKKNA